jgi:acetyltransferase
VAFLSQSGALCTAILDWSLLENVGFSAFVSLGSMLDVNWGDLIDYFGGDPQTTSILMYMETVGDAKAFLSAARDAALRKPIIVIKGGRTSEASKAAASHTGSLAGSDQVFDAALRRVGVLRVDRIGELFSVAEALAKQPRPKGRRLTIVTNAGGPGVLATDTLVRGGGKLAELSDETLAALNAFLPPHWSHGNPIDVLGDADAGRYAKTLEVAARDPHSDGLLVVLTPQDMTDADATAEQLRPLAKIKDKPVLASWMGGRTVERAVRVLNEASIATFPYPDSAAGAFNYLWQYSEMLRNIYETPALISDDAEHVAERTSAAHEVLDAVRASGRTLLTELESKRLLAAYGIPVVPTEVAASAKEAAALAEKFCFPAVIKLNSRTITHKTDVRGVRLNLMSAEEVREAYHLMQADVESAAGPGAFEGVSVQPMITDEGYEIIIGSTLDAQFGPVVMFGAGGQLVEVLRDSAIALPPLNETLANRLMERTRIVQALRGVRGRLPVDMHGMRQALIALSRLVVEQPLIKECDINPLLVSPQRVVALDARIVVHDAATRLEDIPRPAIRPYPAQYIREVRLKEGAAVTLRPIRPEDEPLIVRFHETLSEETVRKRFFQLMQLRYRTEHNRMIRVCSSDYDRELAIVAETHDATEKGGQAPSFVAESSTPSMQVREPVPFFQGRTIHGVARISRGRGEKVAEFAVIVGDAWQGRGLGTALMGQLIEIAKQEGIVRLVGHVLADNYAMHALCKRCGFNLRHDAIDGEVRAVLDL